MNDKNTTIQQLKDLVEKFRTDRSWGKHHSAKNLAVFIAIEAAELLEKFQWDDYKVKEDKKEIKRELADIVIYYLHRGTKFLAFRLPKPVWLRKFLAKTSPLVAPSANPEGLSYAKTIQEAEKYFGKKADFYLDAGKITGRPSKLIKIDGGEIEILRN